jgi:hypothetical protein
VGPRAGLEVCEKSSEVMLFFLNTNKRISKNVFNRVKSLKNSALLLTGLILTFSTVLQRV